jgi:hypothetical protein
MQLFLLSGCLTLMITRGDWRSQASQKGTIELRAALSQEDNLRSIMNPEAYAQDIET